jgi:hypothetical protein
MAAAALTLYDVETNLAALVDTADLVPADQEQAFVAELEAALLSAADKRDRVAQFLAHLEAQAALAESEIKRLRERKAVIQAAQERLEGYVVKIIEALGPDKKGKYRKLEGNTATLSLRACPASVEIADESQIPIDYKTITVKLPATLMEIILDVLDTGLADGVLAHVDMADVAVDRRAIKAAIDRGERVPGADLAIGKHFLVRK